MRDRVKRTGGRPATRRRGKPWVRVFHARVSRQGKADAAPRVLCVWLSAGCREEEEEQGVSVGWV